MITAAVIHISVTEFHISCLMVDPKGEFLNLSFKVSLPLHQYHIKYFKMSDKEMLKKKKEQCV